MTQPQPQLIVKPGGLSTGEHLVHILVVLLTCGLWIPGYIYFAYKAPKARYEVAIPYGADPAAVAALYDQVAVMSGQPVNPVDRTKENRQIAMVIAAGTVVVAALLIAGVWLSNNNPF